MTLNQFLYALQNTDRTWSLVDGFITSNEDDLCPIHEVWLSTPEGEEEGLLEDYFQEGEKLGLRPQVIRRIAAAADNRGCPATRTKLLEACGIERE